MKTRLDEFLLAAKDLNLNDVPSRIGDETFHFSRGQLIILNDPMFGKLSENAIDLQVSRSEHRKAKGEIAVFLTAAEKLEADYTAAIEKQDYKIDEEEGILKVRNRDLNDFNHSQEKRFTETAGSFKSPEKSERRNWNNIIYSLLTWLIGEVFMTYVIWNDLREEKGIEDLIVRSLSFAVVLFLFHLISHYNKKASRPIYYWFLSYSLITLLVMLFAPLTLNKIYPPESTSGSTAEQWSMEAGAGTKQKVVVGDVPAWVELYRDFEMLPAVICFLFFIAIQGFTIRREVPEKEPDPNPIEQHFERLRDKVKSSEDRLQKLKDERRQLIDTCQADLNELYNQQKVSDKEFKRHQKNSSSLEAACEQLLKSVEEELNNYKVEYLDILRDNELKNTIMTPEWPNRNDILNYYKVNAL